MPLPHSYSCESNEYNPDAITLPMGQAEHGDFIDVTGKMFVLEEGCVGSSHQNPLVTYNTEPTTEAKEAPLVLDYFGEPAPDERDKKVIAEDQDTRDSWEYDDSGAAATEVNRKV